MSISDTAARAARTELWLDCFFSALYAADPVSATFIGVHDRDHQLPDYSENGAGDALAEMRALLAACPDAGSDDRTAFERIDLCLARGHLEIRIREYESEHFHRGNPAVYTSEAIFGALSLFLTPSAPIEARVEAAVERLRAVPGLLAQVRANVRSAPAAWTERALRECTGALAFLGEGIDLLVATERIEGRALRDAADVAAGAFRAYRDHLASTSLARTHDRYGCGDELLALCLRAGHHIDTEPDEIARYAESELAAAEARLQERARALGSAAGPADALARLADAHPPAERYYARYAEEWAGARAAVEANALLTWPDVPIRYVPRPPWARAAAPYLYFLFYRSPAAYGRPALHDYLVTPIEPDMAADERTRLLRENNDAVIRLNHVIHHGGIGHHVQNWHAFRSPSRIGNIAAVDGASRIALLCGGTMAEGWACYATDLMDEIGFLTPLEQLAELRARTRMCARALVDVRLHQRRLTLDDAAALYVTRAGMSHAAARAEAVKNSMNPCAALIYLAGRDAIHALRKQLSARAGASFDLRAFHDRFLSFGSIPVSLIAGAMMHESVEGGHT